MKSFLLAVLASLALAQDGSMSHQAPQSALVYDQSNYAGDFVSVPLDGSCVNLNSLSPDLTGRVKSIYSTYSVNCVLYDCLNCGGYTFTADEGGVSNIPTTHIARSLKCVEVSQGS
ncbi:hypothetical protein ASPZODRAFT_133141 [Penicilliopsis zonata CBS 506.65]|uniref:Cyanovirin-N domain-containing protein n=1 Tax=Penicilliopsis zonata CBS 506.65 TaxID=1073090 RepID=A0A1L9SG44_9EURO|nr:hypothetical protein ASPZODRAFT_133141 [Penicilliopsis zonata CBS 506.65]OJJ46142.1 hypothetical protein ASPZODRAFT_133141 [Penicilliopsis zonata CBS 506.65]